ncbi:MAG TPA: phage tail tape measure protein, partial [Abditibacteriaceae bacterium]
MGLHGSVSLDASEAYKELRAMRREMLSFAKDTEKYLNPTFTLNLDKNSFKEAKTLLASISKEELRNAKDLAKIHEVESRTRLNNLRAIGAETRNLHAEERRQLTQTRELERQASRERNVARQTELQSVRAINKELREAKAARDQLGDKAGTAATLGGAALLGGIGIASKDFIGFDRQLRNINTVAKLSEKGIQDLGNEIIRLSSDPQIRKGPEDLANALYDIYSSGKSGSDALDTLEQSAKGASAGLTQTKTAAGVTLSVLQSGIGGVNDSKQALDVLFKTVDRGRLNFEELSGTLGAVLPTASKAGISLQELGAYIAVATKQGQSASEATNDLLNLITKIANPGKEARDSFEKLGIQYGFSALQAKGLSGVLVDIQAKTNGNADAIKKLLPDMQAQRGALTGLTNAGADLRTELEQQKHAFDGAGAAAEAMAKQNKGAAYEADLLAKDLKILSIEAGKAAAPAMHAIVKETRDAVKWFNDLDKETQSQIVQFGLYGGAALLAAGQLKNVLEISKQLKAVGLFSALSANPAALAAGLTVAAGGYLLVSNAMREAAEAEREVIKGGETFNEILTKTGKLLPDVSPYARSLSDLKDELRDAGKDLGRVHQTLKDLTELEHKIEIDPNLSQSLQELLLKDIRAAQSLTNQQENKIKIALVPVWERAGRPVWDGLGITAPKRPLWDLQSSGDRLVASGLSRLLYPNAYGGGLHGERERERFKDNLQSGSKYYQDEIARANRERNAYGPPALDENQRRYRLQNEARQVEADGAFQREKWAQGLAKNEGRKAAQLAAQEAKNEEARKANEKAAREREKREREALQEHFRKQKSDLQNASQAWREYGKVIESVNDRLIDKLGGTRDSIIDLVQSMEARLLGTKVDSRELSTFYGLAGNIKKGMGDEALLGGIYDKSRATSEAAESKARALDTLRDNIDSSGTATGVPSHVAAMLKDSGKVIGLQCGEAITKYLRESGIKGTSTSLTNRPNIGLDASGKLPPGTIVRARKNSEAYPKGHYMVVGPDGEHWVESNYGIKQGITKNRPINWARDMGAATWNGQLHAYLPPGAARSVPSTQAKGAANIAGLPDYEAIRKRAERPEFNKAYTEYSTSSLGDLLKLHPEETEENKSRREALLLLAKLNPALHEYAAKKNLVGKAAQEWVKQERAAIYALGNFVDLRENADRKEKEFKKSLEETRQAVQEAFKNRELDAPPAFGPRANQPFDKEALTRGILARYKNEYESKPLFDPQMVQDAPAAIAARNRSFKVPSPGSFSLPAQFGP